MTFEQWWAATIEPRFTRDEQFDIAATVSGAKKQARIDFEACWATAQDQTIAEHKLRCWVHARIPKLAFDTLLAQFEGLPEVQQHQGETVLIMDRVVVAAELKNS